MRRSLRVFLIVAAVVILALGALYLTQRSNIDAAVVALTSSEEEIQQRRDQAKDSLKAKVEDATGLDLEEIEAEALEESGRLPGGGFGAGTDLSTGTSGVTSDPSGAAAAVETLTEAAKDDDAFRTLLKRFYQLQGSFSGQLASLPDQAATEFYALPEAERTEDSKFSIIRKYVGVAASLETQCDGQVLSLVSQLRTVLQEREMDGSIADRVLDYYVEEKGLQKAAYLNQYRGYLS